MKSVRVTFRYDCDTIHPMHRFVAEHEAFGPYKLVHWNVSGAERNTLLFHVVGDPDAYEVALADVSGISSYEVASGRNGSFSVYVYDVPDEFDKAFLDAFTDRDVIVVSPIEYRDDWTVRLTIVGAGPQIRRTLESVPDSLVVDVERIGEYGSTGTIGLTGRQRNAIAAASELGYYAVPREASVEDVAGELECAPGTAAEHLRKAERKVFENLDL